MSSTVEHPRHYNVHPSGLECMQLVERMSFCLGNAVKYLWRAPHKGARMEDLKKAAFYLDHAMATPPSDQRIGSMDDYLMRLAKQVRDTQGTDWTALTIWSICMGQCGSVTHLQSARAQIAYHLAHPQEQRHDAQAQLPA